MCRAAACSRWWEVRPWRLACGGSRVAACVWRLVCGGLCVVACVWWLVCGGLVAMEQQTTAESPHAQSASPPEAHVAERLVCHPHQHKRCGTGYRHVRRCPQLFLIHTDLHLCTTDTATPLTRPPLPVPDLNPPYLLSGLHLASRHMEVRIPETLAALKVRGAEARRRGCKPHRLRPPLPVSCMVHATSPVLTNAVRTGVCLRTARGSGVEHFCSRRCRCRAAAAALAPIALVILPCLPPVGCRDPFSPHAHTQPHPHPPTRTPPTHTHARTHPHTHAPTRTPTTTCPHTHAPTHTHAHNHVPAHAGPGSAPDPGGPLHRLASQGEQLGA